MKSDIVFTLKYVSPLTGLVHVKCDPFTHGLRRGLQSEFTLVNIVVRLVI